MKYSTRLSDENEVGNKGECGTREKEEGSETDIVRSVLGYISVHRLMK